MRASACGSCGCTRPTAGSAWRRCLWTRQGPTPSLALRRSGAKWRSPPRRAMDSGLLRASWEDKVVASSCNAPVHINVYMCAHSYTHTNSPTHSLTHSLTHPPPCMNGRLFSLQDGPHVEMIGPLPHFTIPRCHDMYCLICTHGSYAAARAAVAKHPNAIR